MAVNSLATQTQGNTGLDTYRPGGFGIEGMEELDQGDLILPRKTIMQPLQKREQGFEHLGWFWDNLLNEATETLEALVLRINKSGTKWTGNLEDKSPECVSMDGATGSKYGTCVRCQFNPEVNPGLWQLPSSEAKGKRCNRGYLLLCAEYTEALDMFLLGISGTSVRPWKFFQTNLVNLLKRERLSSTVEKVIKFATELKTDAETKYFVLAPSIVGGTEAETAKIARELARSMSNVKLADIPMDDQEDVEQETKPPSKSQAASPVDGNFDDGAPLPPEPTEARPRRVPQGNLPF